MEIPVYFITGFLDSGKTTFARFTLGQEYFSDGSKTLLILCEEGEEEYAPELLKENNTTIAVIDSQEELTQQRLEELQRQYLPERVLIEYNGMWRFDALKELRFPQGWFKAQVICTINGETFEMYLKNMKSLIMDMAAASDLILFNRCTQAMRLADYRRSIKAVNRSAEIIFESEEGELDAIMDVLPYSVDEDDIVIEDEDYGIWYMDVFENPQRYRGKTISFRAMVLKTPDFPPGSFVPGRMAMTCCADDTTFIGFVCKGGRNAEKLETKQWVRVSAKVKVEYQPIYKSEGPVLYASEILPSDSPEIEMVYFN